VLCDRINLMEDCPCIGTKSELLASRSWFGPRGRFVNSTAAAHWQSFEAQPIPPPEVRDTVVSVEMVQHKAFAQVLDRELQILQMGVLEVLARLQLTYVCPPRNVPGGLILADCVLRTIVVGAWVASSRACHSARSALPGL
jgi:hypothetical protein